MQTNKHEWAQTSANESKNKHRRARMNAQTGRNHWEGTNEQQNEREQADSGDQHTVYWYMFYILLAHAHVLTQPNLSSNALISML